MCNVSLQRLNVNSALKSVLKRLRLKMGTWNDSLWDASGSIYQGPIVGRLINLFVWLLCWAAHAAKNKTDNLSHLRKSLEIPARGKFSLNCHTPFFLLKLFAMGYHSSSLQEDSIVLVVLSDFDKSLRLTSCWPQKKVLPRDLNRRIVEWGEPLNPSLTLWLLLNGWFLNKKSTILLMPKRQARITLTCV